MHVRICLVRLGMMFLFLVVSRSGLAAEPASDAAEAASAPAAEPGPQAEQFAHVLTEFRANLAELGILQSQYRTASEQERAEIDKKWKDLIQKGDALAIQLTSAAEKAYVEAPNADPQVTDLLLDVLIGHIETRRFQVQTDNYEEALRLGKLLLDNKCEDKRVYNLAGSAAFALSDFDAAETWLNQAKEEGSISDLGEAYLSSLPKYKQAWAKEKQIRDAEAKADDLPRVLLKTTQGDIELELFENEAPNTVANFISLVSEGFYDGLTFHRVIPGFMAQGGCPNGDGGGGPGYNIPCECYQPNHRLHFRGSLSMAHAGKDTGGSQFFLTFLPTSHLDGKHTVFGRVIKGFDVLHKLERRDPEDPGAPDPDKIIEAKVLRQRDHEYKPQKTGE